MHRLENLRRASTRIRHLAASIKKEMELARLEIRQGRFQRSMAVLAGFSAIVSGFEAYVQHTRGAFANRWMWTPVVLTPFVALTSALVFFSARAARLLLPIVALVSLVDGMVGFFLHVRGIQRMPGGFKVGQYNVVMGPPVFAPLLVTLVGILGLLAAFLRREEPPGKLNRPTVEVRTRRASMSLRESPIRGQPFALSHGRFQQGMALISAFLAVLAGGEAYFEHLRGSYNQRVMWTPVWVTPPMVAAAIGSAISGRVAHMVLPIASVVTFFDGILGFLLHLRGVKRMPGGFENVQFNVTMGPPLFAPLLFSAVGLLGFIAVLMRREQ